MNKAFKILLTLFISLGVITIVDTPVQATTTNFANVVAFVDFSDTTNHNHSSLGCYKQNVRYNDFFTGNPRSMTNYLYNMSYGMFNLTHVMPQHTSNAGVDPYVLPGTIDSYKISDSSMRPELIQQVVSKLEATSITANELDQNNDGNVDNLMIVVPTARNNNTTSNITSHKTCYEGNLTLKGKRIYNYTIVAEDQAYYGYSESGVLLHEFLHTLGLPDLYATGCTPVYTYDIMSSVSLRVSYPLAYYRQQLGWLNPIEEITQTTSNISLTAPTRATQSDKQAVILKTPYSNTEFFVVEFRKKEVASQATSELQHYDNAVGGSGLIVYRINTSKDNMKNTTPGPWSTYIFRPQDTVTNGKENAGGNIERMYLTDDSAGLSGNPNVKTLGTADLSKGLSDGAITYSDGTNSGIVIDHVSSSTGNSMTFNVTFNDFYEDHFTSKPSYTNSDYKDAKVFNLNNNIYSFVRETNGQCKIVKYNDSGWTTVSTIPSNIGISNNYELGYYNNQFYVLYTDDNAVVHLIDASNPNTKLFNGTKCNNIKMLSSSNGLYFALETSEGIYTYKYNGTNTNTLGSKFGSSSVYPVNPQFVEGDNGHIYLSYREFFNESRVVLQEYNGSSWTSCSINLKAPEGFTMSKGNNCILYTASNLSNKNLNVCQYNTNTNTFNMLANAIPSSGSSEVDCIELDNTLYVAYKDVDGITKIKKYVDNAWQESGLKVTNCDTSNLQLSSLNNVLSASYINTSTNTIEVKQFVSGCSHTYGNYQQENDKTHTRVCGKDASHIERRNHTYSETVIKQPSCMEVGTMKYTCSQCSYSKTEDIAKIGHDYKTSINQTCDSGIKTITCSRCSYKSTSNIGGLGHDYKTSVNQTCDSGTKTTTCSRCSYKATSNIGGTGHNYSGYIGGYGASCTGGSYSGYRNCTKCNTRLDNGSYGGALGHAYDSWVVAPSETVGGYTVHNCVRGCGWSYTDNYTPATGLVLTRNVKYNKKKKVSVNCKLTDGSFKKATYKKTSGSKNITISKSGIVSVKKNTKRGTYSIKVTASVKKTKKTKAKSKKYTVTINVI